MWNFVYNIITTISRSLSQILWDVPNVPAIAQTPFNDEDNLDEIDKILAEDLNTNTPKIKDNITKETVLSASGPDEFQVTMFEYNNRVSRALGYNLPTDEENELESELMNLKDLGPSDF